MGSEKIDKETDSVQSQESPTKFEIYSAQEDSIFLRGGSRKIYQLLMTYKCYNNEWPSAKKKWK